jgi:putative CocE/NonD family hydrolase
MLNKGLSLLALSFALASMLASSQSAPEIITEHNIPMKTGDGVTLRADIYRPSGTGKFPVLLQRTPYDKGNTSEFAFLAASRGYLVVVQDVRGRFASEGEWYPFKYETQDGYDTVEWAASLPNSNGKVGMFGGSYVGATQLLAAIGHPPHLVGICPIITASNYHENWTYHGGAFEQWFNESWTSFLAQDSLNRLVRNETDALINSTVLPLRQYPLFNLRLDPGSASTTAKLAPYFLDWLNHSQYDGYWKQWSIEENYTNIQVPALTIGAWYDIFQGGSLRNYLGMKAQAGNKPARTGQRLLMTIGGHAGTGRKIGAVDFGPAAEEFDGDTATLDWYDYLLLGKQNEFATEKPVKIFVMGENKWRYEDTWPLERAKEASYFLHSSGKANGASGDGSLSTETNPSEMPDTFKYDPANPVPTVGGPLCCDAGHLAPGPQDQTEVEKRPDVLVYSTPPLDQDLEVTGPVRLYLYAKSSEVDTDFTAKLVDVWPGGFAQNLTEGILRARYRESTAAASPLIPGRIYKFNIDLWSTSNVFLKGHRIRVEVSSSNFPRFDRNLSFLGEGGTGSTFVDATNTIYHDTAHPSALVLQSVPR